MPAANIHPGGLRSETVVMKVLTGIAGTYTAKIAVPAFSFIWNVALHAVALWNAGTTAVGTVGDADDDDGFFTDVNLKGTDLLAGESLDFFAHGNQPGAYIVGTLPTGHWEQRWSAAARVITFTNILVGTAATTGETAFTVQWFQSSGARPTRRVFA